jgi:hypothetical protein
MKNTFLYSFYIVLLTFLISCEKEIDLKYKHDFDRLVVEAIIVKGDSFHQIRVSREVNYFKNPEFIPAENISITIKDEAGNVGTFYYLDSGYYRLDNYNINYRTRYTLTLKDGDKTVEASSRTSSEITLDSIQFATYSFSGYNHPGLIPVFKDPAGEKNYYLGRILVNNYPANFESFIQQKFTDELIDGKNNFNPMLCYYASQDTIQFTLNSVDYYRYQFIKTLNEASNPGGLFEAAPSNPISNFKDKALGYFSVEVHSEMMVIVP